MEQRRRDPGERITGVGPWSRRWSFSCPLYRKIKGLLCRSLRGSLSRAFKGPLDRSLYLSLWGRRARIAIESRRDRSRIGRPYRVLCGGRDMSRGRDWRVWCRRRPARVQPCRRVLRGIARRRMSKRCLRGCGRLQWRARGCGRLHGGWRMGQGGVGPAKRRRAGAVEGERRRLVRGGCCRLRHVSDGTQVLVSEHTMVSDTVGWKG